MEIIWRFSSQTNFIVLVKSYETYHNVELCIFDELNNKVLKVVKSVNLKPPRRNF